jgi:hypothetical protein
VVSQEKKRKKTKEKKSKVFYSIEKKGISVDGYL